MSREGFGGTPEGALTIEAWLSASDATTPSGRERRDHAGVGQEAGAEEHARLGALELGEPLPRARGGCPCARSRAATRPRRRPTLRRPRAAASRTR